MSSSPNHCLLMCCSHSPRPSRPLHSPPLYSKIRMSGKSRRLTERHCHRVRPTRDVRRIVDRLPQCRPARSARWPDCTCSPDCLFTDEPSPSYHSIPPPLRSGPLPSPPPYSSPLPSSSSSAASRNSAVQTSVQLARLQDAGSKRGRSDQQYQPHNLPRMGCAVGRGLSHYVLLMAISWVATRGSVGG